MKKSLKKKLKRSKAQVANYKDRLKTNLSRAYIVDRIFHGVSFATSMLFSNLRTLALKMRSDKIGNGITINSDSLIIHTAKLKMGNNISIGRRAFISAKGGLTIGNNVLIAFDCVILTEEHIYGKNITIWNSGFKTAPVRIGDNVLIGTKAIIMPGVIIGNNVVIGAHSVVTKDIPSNSVAAGIPAKVLRKIN